MNRLAVILLLVILVVVIGALSFVGRSRVTGESGRSRAMTEFLPAAIFGALMCGTVAIAMRMPIRELRWLPAIAGGVGFCVFFVAIKIWWRGREAKIQFGLRTLLLIPVLVGILLAAFMYLRGWRDHRPGYQQYDGQQYQAAYLEFIGHVQAGRIDAAYDVTSDGFRQHMSREQFKDLFRRYPEILRGEQMGAGGGGPAQGDSVPLVNGTLYNHSYELTPGDRRIGLWIWVVMRDSLCHHRPPTPQVEEIAVREINERNWNQWPQPTWQDW